MPAATKHDAVLTELPTARKALAVLRSAGHSDLATSVQHVLDYAKDQAERGVAKRMTDSALDSTTHSLRVTPEFRERVTAGAAEDGAIVSDIVVQSLRDFVSGDWTPAAPQRARRGTNLTKVAINVRVPKDLWAAANTLGRDPAAAAERGYKIFAESASISALRERFGDSESTTA